MRALDGFGEMRISQVNEKSLKNTLHRGSRARQALSGPELQKISPFNWACTRKSLEMSVCAERNCVD